MDSRKNRGMVKLFPCFRSDAVDHDYDGNGRAFAVQTNGKPPLGNNKGRKIMHSSDESSSLSSSLSSSDDADSSVDGGSNRSKGSSRRRFSRALKAVFFDTSLSRKIRERKSRKKSFRSSSSVSISAMSDKTVNSINDKSSSFEQQSSEPEEMNRVNSSRSSIFSSTTNASSSLSSSCASSRNADSRLLTERRGSSRAESMDRRGSFRTSESSFRATNNPVERRESFRGSMKSMDQLQKQNSPEKKIDQYYYSSTIGLCLLLVSLLVLVFWGKICAIFCTSVWLFFGPRRIKSLDSPVKIASSMNVDSEEYKKRVIMEGLLERNRGRTAAQ